MRCLRDTTWLWNTGQDKRNVLTILFVFLGIKELWARPDFLDTMSRQFFGLSSENEQSSPDPFAEMFGSPSQQVPQRPPPRNHQNPNLRPANHPHRQGYYAPPHIVHQQPHGPPHIIHQQPHGPPHIVQQQSHVSYNGPPPVYGQQQGFGQRQPNSNETKTEGYPPDNTAHQQHHKLRHPYPPVEYHPHHHQQPVAAIEYHKPPATVVEYQTPYPQHPPQHVEYHHIPQQPAVVQEQHGPTLEIHTGTNHAYHEPPAHVEYHHPPEVEYHHYTTHKPKRFHLSFNEPSPDYKIIDKHVKLPPVKFRFHINPKIVITTNTKDPLDKKHHDHEHDLEPYPPPDAFSDHNAPPSINKHVVEHYPIKHHYPVEHHVVEHHGVEYPEARHPYPIEHHAVQHHPGQEFTYDLSHGHSHLNPHRSLGHYEPTFKIKTKPIIFTEPPPTRPTTTTRATTTTARTTTARTTARTTTARPTRRARISARNPAFSVAFTQASSTLSTTEASTTSSTTTRRSIFRNNSERESENGGILARRDELSTSAEVPQTTKSTSTTTTTTTTTTSKPTTTTTSASTTTQPTSTTSTTTPVPTTSTTTTTTPKPIPTTTTTTTRTTTPQSTTTEISRSSITTSQPATVASTTTTTPVTTTTQRATTTLPTIRPRASPAEETTIRTTTFNVNVNEIDMSKTTEAPRRRPEPLLEESSSIDRSGSYNIESSESVKVIETTMLIDGKNQTVRFYYITQPVKLPVDVFKKMTGQSKDNPSRMNVIKIRDKRYAVFNQDLKMLRNL